MSTPVLDVERFRKCAAMMRRGATAGERAAGEAAASRVAAAAGLTLEEALRRGDGSACKQEALRSAPGRPTPRPTPKPKPKTKKGPVTLAELRAEREREEAEKKKKAAREEKRLRTVYAAQEAANAPIREEQARRDREWAEAKARETGVR